MVNKIHIEPDITNVIFDDSIFSLTIFVFFNNILIKSANSTISTIY